MTVILTTTGILTAITVITGAAVLMAAVALTSVHENVKQKTLSKITRRKK